MTSNETPDLSEYRLPIRRPVTTAMLFLTLVVFGLKSYQGLPLNLMPDISYPTLTVRTEYDGGAPEDIEKLVTRPLEETLSLVSGMVEISSISSPGISEIILEFTWDTDMNVAQQDVRDRLDLYDPPREVTEKPIILRYDPTLDPVLRVAITGPEIPESAGSLAERERLYEAYLGEIREAAERHVKGDLEGEIGIAQVNVKGGIEKEIQILVDSERLKNQGMSLMQVSNALAQQNINLSGGSLREGKTEYLVRTLNEYQNVDQVRDTIIAAPAGRQIRLGDVARVFMGEKDRETIVRINGREAVELEIFKDGDANTVQVCRKLKVLLGFEVSRSILDEMMRTARTQGLDEEEAHQIELARTLRSRLPETAELAIISDQSRFIEGSIKEVQSTAVIGGLLALFILYFFLRDMRSTAIIGVAIPISVVATFIPMFMRDISLNIMSLGGLALGIGMLVDNSIVVLESIFRCKEEGDERIGAANRGTTEVGSAVTASTLTTIAVFMPIAFVEGVAGQLFRDQALTVTFSLLASLLVALYLIPMIASRTGFTLERGVSAVWLLRAYNEARAQDGRGRIASIMHLPRVTLRNAVTWVRDLTTSTYGPTLQLWSPQNANITVVLLKRVFVPPLLIFMSGVFLFMILTKILSVILTTALFATGLLVAGAALGALGALKLVLAGPLWLFDRGFSLLRVGYEVFLRTTLKFGPVLVLLVVLVAFHAGQRSLELGRELIPPLKQGEFGIRMQAPPGTRLIETARQAREIERLAMALPEVETVAVQIGQEKTRATGQRGENVADFTILLRDPETTAQYQDTIIEALRQQVQMATPNEVTFTLPVLFSFKAAIELQIRGDDIRELRRIGREALALVENVPGLRDADLSMKEGYPEVIIELDRELLAAKNLSADDVAQRLRREVQGDIATRFNEQGYKVDMRVRTDQQRMSSVQDLRMLSVVDGTPPLPLYRVAKRIDIEEGPSEIRRVDQRQVAMITGNVEGRDLASVTADMMRRLEALNMPDDYSIVAGGQTRELETSYRSLLFALALAVFLVYVVMACQFESVLHPALVMCSVPLAGIGVIYALDWLRIDLSIIVFIGAITLAGIVVNNAIVLIDYINQLRARGIPKREAVVQAGQVRLRPILMTTLTTVLGLVPMAVYMGEGAEIRRPMAITIMAGLMMSTVLTLVILPTIYDLFGGRDKTRPKEAA